jgi:hypothetical protein
MRKRLVAAAALFALAGDARAKSVPPKPQPAHAPAPHFARPIPMLPSVSRVRVEVAPDHVVQTEEVALPKGDWHAGSLDFYVAFGSPGTPSAVDARLVPVPEGAGEARWEEAGEPVGVEPAMRQGPGSQLLLGRAAMAGFIVRLKEADLRQVYASGDLAALRIRSLLVAPAVGADGARDVVVRLGIHGGLPLALGRVQVVSADSSVHVARADAHLCGPEADPWPLAVSILPRPVAEPRPPTPPIAPLMAVRHSTDDLCVRWWQ